MSRGADRGLDSPTERIGIFGGTFDPPHLGHVRDAAEVADRLQLHRVLWIPARRSPHKPDRKLTPDEVRLEMTRAAAAADARFEVSEIELERPPPSYTVDTLRALRDRLGPEAELYLIIGVDQYEAFDRWHEPEAIRRLATLAVMDRGGEGAAEGTAGAGVVRVPVERVEVSSTEVRARAAAGASIRALVPEVVARIIEHEGLYRR
jgi:nicotinate-nucleotide adenylyltransferase